MCYLKQILIFTVFVGVINVTNANVGKEYYEEDCASSCHASDPREGHVNLVILNRFDLRSQIKACSSRFAPFWEREERDAVVDYLYSNFYKEQYAKEEVEKEESILFNCEKKFQSSPRKDDF